MLTKIHQAWSELEPFQKVLLTVILILFPLGLVFPPVMELLMLPLSLITCGG